MTKLYALPDHEVMENLLPSICNEMLSVDEAIERLQSQVGFVPVAINPNDGGSVYFANINDTPFVEWKFIYTIERLAKENAISEMFVTDISILEREEVVTDGMSPNGIIFHVSRCGSTLFTKAIARSPYNLTISQGGPLQEGFWAFITDNWQHEPEINERNIRMLRNLVLLMARKRRPEYTRCFVKLISWNIIYHKFICTTFPEAETLYLYRDPIEVIATVLQETTAVLRSKGQRQAYSLTGLPPEETATMGDAEYLACCYAHYFNIAYDTSDDSGLHLVNYKQLMNSESFADILKRGFKLETDGAELAQMREQYRYYSKDDTDTTIFKGDTENMLDILADGDKQIIGDICNEGLARLNSSKRNLYPIT
jgi:hypothetical protein